MYVCTSLKALGRESRDLDRITLQYSSTLQALNPRMLDNLYSVYKDKVGDRKKEAHRQHQDYHHHHDNNNTHKDANNLTSEFEVPKPFEQVKPKAIISKYSRGSTTRLQPNEVRERSDATLLDDEDENAPIAHTYTWKNRYMYIYCMVSVSAVYVCIQRASPCNVIAVIRKKRRTTMCSHQFE